MTGVSGRGSVNASRSTIVSGRRRCGGGGAGLRSTLRLDTQPVSVLPTYITYRFCFLKRGKEGFFPYLFWSECAAAALKFTANFLFSSATLMNLLERFELFSGFTLVVSQL